MNRCEISIRAKLTMDDYCDDYTRYCSTVLKKSKTNDSSVAMVNLWLMMVTAG